MNAKTGTGSLSISQGEASKRPEVYAGKLELYTKEGFTEETNEN